MRNGWMLLPLSALCLLGKGQGFVTGKHMSVDDLYLDEQSGDDEINSGSASGNDGDDEDFTQTTSLGPEVTSFNLPDTWLTSTDAGQQVTEKEKFQGSDITTSTRSIQDVRQGSNVVQSENLFQRTEVLAAVIAGGVIGFLFAIFLILLLVYRMRKKDEGSYDLQERKLQSTAYQKAPTKEYYA